MGLIFRKMQLRFRHDVVAESIEVVVPKIKVVLVFSGVTCKTLFLGKDPDKLWNRLLYYLRNSRDTSVE